MHAMTDPRHARYYAFVWPLFWPWLWLHGPHVGADAARGGAAGHVLLHAVGRSIKVLRVKDGDFAFRFALVEVILPLQESDVGDHP